MNKLSALILCFTLDIIWAMFERYYGIEIVDQVIIACVLIFMIYKTKE